MKLFGIIEIERKIDVLAMIAFVVSLLTAAYQIGIYFIGPSAKLLNPEGVDIAQFEGQPGYPYVSVVAPIAIANTSAAQEPLLVLRQTATITIGERSIPLTWYDVIKYPVYGKAATFETIQAVRPFIIDTKKINSELIRFTPHVKFCVVKNNCGPNESFVSPDEFQVLMLAGLQKGSKYIELEFSVEFENHPTVSRTCLVPLMPNFMKEMRESKHFTELCKPD